MGARRYGLRDDQWERIEELLPGRKGSVGRPAQDNRLFVDAVLYRYRAGIPWRDLPERFGDFRVVHTRFSRWAKRGVWKKLFERLASDADNEYAMIDSTIVRAHQHSAGALKKGAATKPSGTARATEHQDSHYRGCAGQSHWVSSHWRAGLRSGGGRCVVAAIGSRHPAGRQRLRRRPAGSDSLARGRQGCGDPAQANRTVQREYDQELYKARHLIENFFAKLKLFRAIATRYDKTARNFLAAIHLAASVIWLI